jgi:EpsD family peptidyl-prolyl cis-trans isomerase
MADSFSAGHHIMNISHSSLLGGRTSIPSALIWFASKFLVVGMIVLALGACGDRADIKAANQVAAKVGSEEISMYQINFVLSRTNTASASPESAERLRREVLEKLIDQQLAVQQALEKKLDRLPEVVLQLEAARHQVLSRAYIQQLAGSLPKPAAEETRQYYQENPPLFSERRIYNLQEIVVPVATGGDLLESIKTQVSAGKSMEELAAWLKGRNVRFGGNSAARSAEQIPLELLRTVATLKDGQTTVIANPQGFTILRVASAQSAPVSETAALPRIEQFLANQRGAEAVSKNMKDLRSKTAVTYLGDFAPGAGKK